MTDEKMPDCVWPEWEFVKQIGKGSYGVVYEAVRRDEFKVESHAAVKVISIPQDESEIDSLRTEGLDLAASKTYMKNVTDAFVNEVKLMIALKGAPNIVSVDDYKVVERENTIGWDISIRMELLKPLNSYISVNKMTEKEVAKLGCDICCALETCEKKNVIHRDIKPANIFIDDFGNFKLGDFGIARQAEAMTVDYSRKGTGGYMAPEVEKGEHYNTSVDLYSLGLVLYALLNNNRLPFLDPEKQILTPTEREKAIRRRLDGETLPAPRDASPVMANIILTACAYDPNRRFVSAAAMKNALQNILNQKATSQKQADKKEAPVQEPSPEQSTPPGEATLNESEDQTADVQTKSTRLSRKTLIGIIAICIIVVVVICVVFGVRAHRNNKAQKYEELVEQQISYRDSGDVSGETAAYEQAVELFPSDLESYYQHARTLHEEPVSEELPDYSACISFIEKDILQNEDIDKEQEGMADIYYLYADSFFQNGDYTDAVNAYQKLFQIGTNEALYYRDYAIALAYNESYSEAETLLEEAERLGLSDDNVYYTKAEVEKARSEYEDALADFSNCIELSDNEDLIAHAYLSCADIYRLEGDRDEERNALLSAKNYESTKTPQILQELIRVDMDLADVSAELEVAASAYRQEAIELLNQVITNGWQTFTTYNNLIILYQQENELEQADEILNSIENDYKEDYRWYKRYAFWEIYEQNSLENADRDYTAFEKYYNDAKKYYQEYLNSGGSTDSEMEVLDLEYEEVKNGDWLDE